MRPIYNGQTSVSFAISGTSTAITANANHCTNCGTSPDNTTWYYHADQVGSNRLITVPSPAVANAGYPTWQATWLPFGFEKNQQAGVNEFKFATYGRDTEGPGLDYAHFRYYSSQFGRFMNADPVSGDPANPQSWNRYAYVLNNPMNAVDLPGAPGLAFETWDTRRESWESRTDRPTLRLCMGLRASWR